MIIKSIRNVSLSEWCLIAVIIAIGFAGGLMARHSRANAQAAPTVEAVKPPGVIVRDLGHFSPSGASGDIAHVFEVDGVRCIRVTYRGDAMSCDWGSKQ